MHGKKPKHLKTVKRVYMENSNPLPFQGSVSINPPEKSASGGSGAKAKKRNKRGINPFRGSRWMKEYPVTEGELRLFWVGAFSTLLFSVATGLVGFAVNIRK